MNVIINAISIKMGGGLVVLTHLLEEMHKLDPTIHWHVAASPQTLAKLPSIDAISGHPYSWINKSPAHHLYWYEIELPKLLRRVRADLCFSQTNFLSRHKLPCPSLLLVQNAGYFSEKYKQLHFQWNNKIFDNFIWNRKTSWVHQSIKNATAVTVQTYALAEKISQQVGISKDKIHVVPHGTGLIKNSMQSAKIFPKNKIWHIGYVTKLGYQKDFETAFKAIYLLKKKKIAVKLILTLDENDLGSHPLLNQIKKQILKYGIEDSVHNHGEISNPIEISDIYQSLDIFIFPSLCESFGFTLVEAMKVGLPVVVANTESNCELTAEAGHVFSAQNADDMADKIYHLINSEEKYESSSIKSLARSNDFTWRCSAQKMISLMYKIAGKKS